MNEEITFVSPWLIKDFLYKQVLTTSTYAYPYIQVMSEIKKDADKIFPLLDGYLLDAVRKDYEEYYQSEPTLGIKETDENLVIWFRDRIKQEILAQM